MQRHRKAAFAALALASGAVYALAPLRASAGTYDTGGVEDPTSGTVIAVVPEAYAAPDQEAGWTVPQVRQHQAKLVMLSGAEANDPYAATNILQEYQYVGPHCYVIHDENFCVPVTDSATMSVGSSCGPDGCPPSSASINEDGAIEPDGYCGPTSAHNVLWAFGMNVDIYTIANAMGQYNNQGVGRGGWDGKKWWGEAAINDYSGSYNAYEWSTANTAGDLWYMVQSDIWDGVGPIFNIASYGYDPQTQSYRFPLPQYPESYNGYSPIRHYLPAFGYKPSYDIQVFDENNYLSSHFWDDNAGDMWAAAYMNFNNSQEPSSDGGVMPQVLW